MKFIHIIHRLTKLSTLKHSCFSGNFALKHSWKYAETLLCSIYTYIYLYKNTCIRAATSVNNFFIKIFFIVVFSVCLSGCHKTIYICNKPINKLSVKEIPATNTHPAQFYLCGNHQYPCKSEFRWHEIKKCHPTSSKKRQGNFYEKCIAEKNVYHK
ncbi:hypothetical protein AQULUS_24020 (plasmid) [Aquicella lusitana]|uniref:Uncharacterized protein n=1 Tax=Aquicella lusitana TaxID=254246 RepID=A0A370GGM2_9COXI|nr:hypothetical protein C8D86_12111 [Aquicella lusitana]VVC74636.1 hypothetical protein AQULUS_24020 [Aquicella lusitana]